MDEKTDLEEKIVEALCTVYDPEIPVNIYELGLIYDIAVDEDAKVAIKMTLTAPACPVAGEMPGMVERAVAYLEEVAEVSVELVWEPPWTPEMMNDAARLQLGM
ncbi:MAG: SUF system Fe-S cluster assembly protein [Deltaproteobacteria bacterium]